MFPGFVPLLPLFFEKHTSDTSGLQGRQETTEHSKDGYPSDNLRSGRCEDTKHTDWIPGKSRLANPQRASVVIVSAWSERGLSETIIVWRSAIYIITILSVI